MALGLMTILRGRTLTSNRRVRNLASRQSNLDKTQVEEIDFDLFKLGVVTRNSARLRNSAVGRISYPLHNRRRAAESDQYQNSVSPRPPEQPWRPV